MCLISLSMRDYGLLSMVCPALDFFKYGVVASVSCVAVAARRLLYSQSVWCRLARRRWHHA